VSAGRSFDLEQLMTYRDSPTSRPK